MANSDKLGLLVLILVYLLSSEAQRGIINYNTVNYSIDSLFKWI